MANVESSKNYFLISHSSVTLAVLFDHWLDFFLFIWIFQRVCHLFVMNLLIVSFKSMCGILVLVLILCSDFLAALSTFSFPQMSTWLNIQMIVLMLQRIWILLQS